MLIKIKSEIKMINKLHKSLLAASLTAVFSSTVYAIEPTAINLENGLSITPFLSKGYKYDDNIFSDSTKSASSGVLTVVPSVNFLLDDGVSQ
jgi:hypothetical protein